MYSGQTTKEVSRREKGCWASRVRWWLTSTSAPYLQGDTRTVRPAPSADLNRACGDSLMPEAPERPLLAVDPWLPAGTMVVQNLGILSHKKTRKRILSNLWRPNNPKTISTISSKDKEGKSSNSSYAINNGINPKPNNGHTTKKNYQWLALMSINLEPPIKCEQRDSKNIKKATHDDLMGVIPRVVPVLETLLM